MEEAAIHWAEVQAWATIGTGVVIFATLIAVLRQIKSSGKTQELQGFVQVVGWLQREEIRDARRTVYMLSNINSKVWSDEDISAAEKVCHNFDVVGDMLRKKLITKRVVDNWAFTIKRCWVIVKPMIEKYRKDKEFPGLWENFQWLAEKKYK